MVFSSFLFIFYLLPAVILFYFAAPKSFKNSILLIFSIFFYTWGEPVFISLLLLLCLVDFLLGLGIQHSNPKRAKFLLIISLIINISALCYFKYTNFFVAEVSRLLEILGFPAITWHKIVLPLGISFFTFHKISYIVDVYRKIRPAAHNPINFLLYILFFPQLIAGPIIRYHEIEDQLLHRKVNLEDLYEGMLRFIRGLAKKVLIADIAGHTADKIFALKVSALAPEHAWLGLLAYTIQIYFDFSGYSDMAIGLARMFGFHFPENFDRPYLARNFTDFWRRWHTSFGRWMREYLYYPLGGSKKGVFRTYLNLWIVFLFSGFWHGAQWTFILWGVFHGFFLTLDKLFLLRLSDRLPIAVQTLFTLFLVMLSRVLFRADNLAHAGYYFNALFSDSALKSPPLLGFITSPHEMSIITLGYIICLWPLIPGLESIVQKINVVCIERGLKNICRSTLGLILFILSVAAMAGTEFSPFIYFQF